MKKEQIRDPARELALISAAAQVYAAAYQSKPDAMIPDCERRGETAIKSFLKAIRENGL